MPTALQDRDRRRELPAERRSGGGCRVTPQRWAGGERRRSRGGCAQRGGRRHPAAAVGAGLTLPAVDLDDRIGTRALKAAARAELPPCLLAQASHREAGALAA